MQSKRVGRKAPVELSITHKLSFDNGVQRDIGEARQPAPVEAYKKTLQVLSLGRLSSDHNDIVFIIRKPALPARADLQVSAATPQA